MVQELPDIAHFNNEKESDLCIIHGEIKLFVKSKLLMNHSGFFKANADFKRQTKIEDDKRMKLNNPNPIQISNLTSSISSFDGFFFFCLWCYSPTHIFTDNFELIFDLMNLSEYFQFSEQFLECLLESLWKHSKKSASLQDQIYDTLKRQLIPLSVILKLSLNAKVDKLNVIYDKKVYSNSYNTCNICGNRYSDYFHCYNCSLLICKTCKAEHALSHMGIDVSANIDALFLFYLPAAYLCTIKYHNEIANLDIISLSKFYLKLI